MNLPFKLAAVLALAASLNSLADVRVNEQISINGYAVGAYTVTNPDGASKTDTFLDSGANNLDAVKFGVLGTTGSLSAYGSILYLPGADDEAGLLDAYVTLDTGIGATITGGKFLSYLGYEAFDAANMTQLSYALISGIPAYHTGAKLDFTGQTFSAGIALVDSIFPGAKGFIEGDREYRDDVGVEAMISYTGIKDLTIFAGIASEETHGADSSLFVFDLWASYAISEAITIAGEFTANKDVAKSWLAFLSYKSTDRLSTVFRVSGASWDAGGDDMQYTIAPTFTVSDNFAVRAEYSLGRGDSGDYSFFGVQSVFRF
jgi:hypothetical protein